VADQQARSALILAGGNGTRLSDWTRRISGDDRPVQFCPLFGDATPLEQARSRAARLITPAQTVVVVVKAHEQFYGSLLADLPPDHVVAQPEDRGTLPAILYGLLRLAGIGAAGPVAVLPADHYVSDDTRFMDYVEAAFRAVTARPDLVVLLGMKPVAAELEYGWIEPDELIPGRWTETFYRVRRFWERPRPGLGEELLTRGCLWNSFVMVAQPIVLATLIRRELPSVVERFLALRTRLASPADSDRVRTLYARMGMIDFSRHILATRPPNLAVLPVTGVEWTNLNHPDRASLARARAGIEPPVAATPTSLSA
jgi:mannose-1-phosphate guanylyltransferase